MVADSESDQLHAAAGRSAPADSRSTAVGLGVRGWLRWGWRQLTSMRTALILLFALALAAIPGSVFPQRGADPLAVAAWLAGNPAWGPILARLGMFDVFSSAWFSAIYLLLFVSLLGCLVPRAAAHWRAARQPIPAAPRRPERLPGALVATLGDSPPDVVLSRVEAILRGSRWRVRSDPTGGWVAAEKGRLRETGNLVFHVALFTLLIGVAVGALFGWRGTVIVREGSGFANSLTQYDTFSSGRLAQAGDLPPFTFKLADFEATFQRQGSQAGAPSAFTAALDYRADPDSAQQRRVVSVNHPLVVDGAKVFLIGHGYAPRLRVTDATGAVVFNDSVVFLPQDGNFTSLGVLKAPDARPQLALQAFFLPTFGLDAARGPHSTFPAPDDPALFASVWTGDLGLDSGRPQNVFSLSTDGLTQVGLKGLAMGQSWDLPDGQGTIEFIGLDRWASFTIAHDPGKRLVLGSAVLAILGLSLSLFVRRRRLWVRLREVPGSLGEPACQMVLAGLERGESGQTEIDVRWLAGQLAGLADWDTGQPGDGREQRISERGAS